MDRRCGPGTSVAPSGYRLGDQNATRPGESVRVERKTQGGVRRGGGEGGQAYSVWPEPSVRRATCRAGGIKPAMAILSTSLVLLDGALGRVGGAARHGGAVERHALDAAPQLCLLRRDG